MSLAWQQRSDYGNVPSAGGKSRLGGFDFTLHMRLLCEDMVARVDRLRHIDMARVAVSFSQARKATSHGMYAALTPMRFVGGRMHTVRRGQKWGVQQLRAADGREMLYILNFYLPRFLDLPLREKLDTVMHELWHISPKFDGDVRRYGGRCFAHGSSQQQYDALVEGLVDRWLASRPPESVLEFLRYDFHGLLARCGRVFGRRIPTPKLIRVG
jgi:predicted metallopeptidase